MKLLIDLNVLLDVIQQREPFYNASAKLLSRVVLRKASGHLPGHAVTTVYYIVRRYIGRNEAEELVDWVLTNLEIITQDRMSFVRARSLALTDFEDAALASAAEVAGCNYIITRNVVDFTGSPIPAITPEQFLSGEIKATEARAATGDPEGPIHPPS